MIDCLFVCLVCRCDVGEGIFLLFQNILIITASVLRTQCSCMYMYMYVIVSFLGCPDKRRGVHNFCHTCTCT